MSIGEAYRDFYRALAWTFGAPSLTGLLIWAVSYIDGIDHHFVGNFSTGEMFSISALMLISVKQDLEKVPREQRDDKAFLLSDEVLLLISVLMWVFFGAIKIQALTLLEMAATRTPAQSSELIWFGVMSLLALTVTVLYGVSIRYKILVSQLQGMAAK